MRPRHVPHDSGGRNDRCDQFGWQQTEIAVDFGCTFFNQGQGVDKGGRQDQPADGEVLRRALGLGAELGIPGNTDRSHCIFFFPVNHDFYLSMFNGFRLFDVCPE